MIIINDNERYGDIGNVNMTNVQIQMKASEQFGKVGVVSVSQSPSTQSMSSIIDGDGGTRIH